MCSIDISAKKQQFDVTTPYKLIQLCTRICSKNSYKNTQKRSARTHKNLKVWPAFLFILHMKHVVYIPMNKFLSKFAGADALVIYNKLVDFSYLNHQIRLRKCM